MDREKNLDILRDDVVKMIKQKQRPPQKKTPKSIRISNVGDGATIVIGDYTPISVGPVQISVTVLIAPTQHGGGFPVPMGMADRHASAAVQAVLDALAPPGSPAILVPARPAAACACPFRCAAPVPGGTVVALARFAPPCSQFPARLAA